MSKFLFMLFMVLYLKPYAQDVYYVTVSGGDVFDQNNRKIEPGDKLSGDEKVTFSSVKGFLILLNTRGRYEISTGKTKSAKSNELTTLLIKDNIHFHADNVRLSSRAIGDAVSLSSYFKPKVLNGMEVNNKILIANELKIPIRNMGYTNVDNKENFFFIQLIDTARNGINKILPVRNDSLVFSMEDLTFNGKLYVESDGILVLGFVEGYSKEKKVDKIAEIRPIFVSVTALDRIVHAIKFALPGLTRDELINEIYTQLSFLFGKPDKQLIEDLYDGKL